MRHGTPGRRQRHRGNNGGQNNGQRRGPSHNRNQIYDSNGPDVRIRGTAHQVCEKYLALAKDAASVGDVVLAESYLQHAEHYQRIINVWNEDAQQNRAMQPQMEQQGDVEQVSEEDDLSLPMSVLGGSVEVIGEQDVRADIAEKEDMLEAV